MVQRGDHLDARDRGEPLGRRWASVRPRAWIQSSPTYIDSQPIERAIPTTDGRWKPDASNRRASVQNDTRRAGRTLEAERAGRTRVEALDDPGSDREGAHALGPSSHLCAGIA